MSQPNDSPIPLTPALSSSQIALDPNPDHGHNGFATVTHADAMDSSMIWDAQGENELAIEPFSQPIIEPVSQPVIEPVSQAVLVPLREAVGEPVIKPDVVGPQWTEQELNVIATAPSGALKSAPDSGSTSCAGITAIEASFIQPTQDVQVEFTLPIETAITDTTPAKEFAEQPPKDDKETIPIPTEAILTEATTAQSKRRGKGTRRMKATITEAISTRPVRKVRQPKTETTTPVKAPKAGPSKRAKETKSAQAATAEPAATRPSKRAKITAPIEATIKTSAERPSKRAKDASSIADDNNAHADIPTPAQQPGRRARKTAEPKPSKRVRKSTTTGEGVEDSTVIVQNQDGHGGKPSPTVTEAARLPAKQSPSTKTSAADNPGAGRKSLRKITAATIDESAPRQPLGSGEPSEMACGQTIEPVVVAKRRPGRPRKVVSVDPTPPVKDSTTPPSGDSIITSTAIQESEPRRRGRPRSTKGVRTGTERKDLEPKESSIKKRPTKSKPRQTGKAVYEDDDERVYEEAIKNRGVRIWETFPMDSNGSIDKWAQMLGVPMRTLPISEEKECLTFPFDMQELKATGSADRVRAFIFFGPDSLQRKPPKGDTDSFAIPFLSQQSVGYGHAVDSCASLSFLNIAMNCPDILENGPASMQQLRATLDDDEKVQSIKHAWRVFDQSVMGEQVHEVHNRIAVAEDSVNEEHAPYNPKEHMRKTRYSQRKAQAMQHDTSASASASEHEQSDAFHFTALMKIRGQVWELDSMETEPIRIPSAEESDWHAEVSNYLQSLTKDLSTYQKNYNCRLIAVV